MDPLDKERLLQEVRDKGYILSSIDDLMYIDQKHRDLIPVLLKNLEETSDEGSKQFLVRCLGVKGFYEVSPALIREFYLADDTSYKWAIGNSLGIIADKAILPDMLRIVQEKEHGIARQMIVASLWKYDCEQTRQVLISLLEDEEVVGHAVSAIARLHDKSLIPYIAPFQTCKTAWIRNTAKRAVKRFEA